MSNNVNVRQEPPKNEEEKVTTIAFDRSVFNRAVEDFDWAVEDMVEAAGSHDSSAVAQVPLGCQK